MNEEMIMNTEMENTEVSVVDDAPEIEIESDFGLIGKVALGLVAAGAGAVALYKNRNKIKEAIEDRRIHKLRKKGYVIYKRDEVSYMDDECEEPIVCEEETEE